MDRSTSAEDKPGLRLRRSGRQDWIYGYIDVSALNAGKPRNDWTRTYSRVFTLDEIDFEGTVEPYVQMIGHPEVTQQTIRIDGQSQSEWQSTSNPPYRFVTLKEITDIVKDDCDSTLEEPPATDPLTAEISSNYTAADGDHVAPATISFDATIAGGTGPYTVNWNFGDDSEVSDEESVVHTFTEAGNYTVTLTVTDSEDQTASDTLEIAVEESSEEPLVADTFSSLLSRSSTWTKSLR